MMKPEVDEIKKRLTHQIAEDFYSRLESNEAKIERLRRLQGGEETLPPGLEIEEEIELPDVSEMHAMLLMGVHKRLSFPDIPTPSDSPSESYKNKG